MADVSRAGNQQATPSFRELLRRRALSRLITYRLRVTPFIAILACGLAALSPTPLRLALFGGAASTLIVIALIEHRANKLRQLSDERLTRTVVITGIIQLVVMFATGGVGGPLLPGVMLIAFVASVLLQPREAGSFVIGIQVPALWVFAAVHHLGLLPELHITAYDGLFAMPGLPGFGPFVAAGFTSLLLIAAFVIGRNMRNVVDELVREMAEEREASLAQHLESARTMSALSGEIAHELKNPLASIKGLTALVHRDLQGVPKERMDVVRREVDRMQGILDEFLTYSRPLVPLTIERVELRELALDVASLHEGLASERGVELRMLASQPVWVRCDPRKVKQVLINLIQNAFDASKRGGEVTLDVTMAKSSARVVVRDHGAGIDASVMAQLFTVGATTKERGTGLGLVVARGLARQHGGDLTLENAEDGGACATLQLPLEAVLASDATTQVTS
jgi:signal transduction histidine kinase